MWGSNISPMASGVTPKEASWRKSPWGWCLSNSATKLYLGIIFLGYCWRAAILWPYFPDQKYAWTELLINYQGGFLRRGLLGELAYQTAPWISPQLSLTVVMLGMYTLVAWMFVRRIQRTVTPAIALPLLLCPALLPYPAIERTLFPFKDIFMFAALLLSLGATARVLAQERCSPQMLVYPTLICTLSMGLATVIHEEALFFLPLPAMLLGAAYDNAGCLRFWFGLLAVWLLLAVCYVLLSFPGNNGEHYVRAIESSWRRYYPTFEAGKAILYIKAPFNVFFDEVRALCNNPQTLRGYIYGALLTLPPLLLLYTAQQAGRALMQVFQRPLLRWLLVPALLSPCIMFLIAQDWGRWISHITFALAVLGCSALTARPQSLSPWVQRLEQALHKSRNAALAYLALLLCYALLWHTKHWVEAGESPFSILFFG